MPLIDPGPLRLHATLLRSESSGAACFVDVPWDLKSTFGKGNLVPVHSRWDDRVDYRGSLAKMGGDHAILLCRKDILAQLGKAAGDSVDVVVRLDTQPRPVDVPDALQASLDAQPDLAAAWARLSPSCQREYAQWIGSAKREDTVARRLEQAGPMIRSGKKLKG